jgi:glucose-1-phosphatase
MEDRFDTIILDLGGVLIDVDYNGSARAFAELGHNDFDRLYSKARQSDLFDRFETGELDPAAFRNDLRRLMSVDLSDEQLDHCWNSMLGTIPEERIQLVKELRRHYTVLLLSNTNSIHVPAFTRIVLERNGIGDFKGLFDGAYFSCEIGARKPDPAIYLDVLRKHDAQADRTLFIDDSPQHVEGARKAGLHAEFLDLTREDIHGLVDRLGLLPPLKDR